MKRLVLILISCVAGCASSEAVHRHPGDTAEQTLWQDDHNRRDAPRGYMLEGRESDRILTEPSPSRDFRRAHED